MKFSKRFSFGNAAIAATICTLAVGPSVFLAIRQRHKGRLGQNESLGDETVNLSGSNSRPIINLVENTGVARTVHGYIEDSHFAEVFRRTWDHIPHVEREVILAYWDKCHLDNALPTPLIEVVPRANATTQDRSSLSFNADDVKGKTDNGIETLIARGLARVSLLAKGMTDEAQNEDTVTELVQSGWRFAPAHPDINP